MNRDCSHTGSDGAARRPTMTATAPGCLLSNVLEQRQFSRTTLDMHPGVAKTHGACYRTRLKMKKLCWFLACFATFAAHAQQIPEPSAQPGRLRVLVKPVKPFAFEENGELTGYSIDLWKRVAEEAGMQYDTPQLVKTVPEVLDALQRGEADIGVGALSITADREKVLDFSHPFYESGLQILTHGKGEQSGLSAFKSLLRSGVLTVIAVLLLALLVVSNILWFFERKRNPECFPETYKQGLWEATWWSISTLISGGCENKAPLGVAGRLVAILWMLGGIGLTSYITATLASAMTVTTLTSDIRTLGDLQGHTVGTVTGSSAEVLLRKVSLVPTVFPEIESALAALSRGELKAVVYDSPILQYYLATHGNSGLHLAGKPFDVQHYGFALPLGSPHRKRLNEALLKLQIEGFRDELNKKWFAAVKQ